MVAIPASCSVSIGQFCDCRTCASVAWLNTACDRQYRSIDTF